MSIMMVPIVWTLLGIVNEDSALHPLKAESPCNDDDDNNNDDDEDDDDDSDRDDDNDNDMMIK